MTTETHAKETSKAYCLFDNIAINDLAKLEEYKEKVFPVVTAFGGKYLVASNRIRVVEGNWQPNHVVMIEFPSYEAANRWYDSEEYKALKNLRQSSGKFDGMIVEGLTS